MRPRVKIQNKPDEPILSNLNFFLHETQSDQGTKRNTHSQTDIGLKTYLRASYFKNLKSLLPI